MLLFGLKKLLGIRHISINLCFCRHIHIVLCYECVAKKVIGIKLSAKEHQYKKGLGRILLLKLNGNLYICDLRKMVGEIASR